MAPTPRRRERERGTAAKRAVKEQKPRAQRAAKPGKPQKQQRPTSMAVWLLYALLFASLILYSFTQNPLFGALFVAVFVIVVAAEIRESVTKEGLRKTAIEVATAVVAIVAIWFGVVFLLGSSSPLNVVPSCSMLPVLHVGDVVLLHGIGDVSAFLASHNIPVVSVSGAEYDAMVSNMDSEYLAYFAYSSSNRSQINYVFGDGNYSIGLYNTKCLSQYSYFGQRYNYYKCYVADQSDNLIRYNYSIGRVSVNGASYRIVYTSAVDIAGTTVRENYSNPIIVYATTSQDTFGGDIVHRVVAAIDVDGTYHLLTQGDNNQALDIEFGNYPIDASSDVLGYVIGSAPYVGYVTLAFKGGISTAGCNQTITR